MNVSSNAVLLVPNHKSNLAVGLEAHETVDDVAAGLLQLLGPLDIVLLIEAGLELYEYRDLLPVLGRLLQGRDDGGIAGYPVEVMARTCSSTAAARMKSTTGSKES